MGNHPYSTQTDEELAEGERMRQQYWEEQDRMIAAGSAAVAEATKAEDEAAATIKAAKKAAKVKRAS